MKWFYTINRFRDLIWRLIGIFVILTVYSILLEAFYPIEVENTIIDVITGIFALLLSITTLFFIGGYIYTRFVKK